MEASIHRFARLLRTGGVRVSVSEVLDAIEGCRHSVLAERETFRQALRSSLIKDHRDDGWFDEVFDAFFALVSFGDERSRAAARAEAADGHELSDFTLSDELGQRPPRADMESPDADLGDLFDEADRIERHSPHPELNPVVLDNETDDEVVFSQQDVGSMDGSNDVQLQLDRMHGAHDPGRLSQATGTPVDAELSVAEQGALLGWLDGAEQDGADGDEDDAARLADRLSGTLAALPEALRRHIEQLMAIERDLAERGEARTARVDRVSQQERDQLEESLRRLAFSLRGAPTHRKREAARGRVDSARTMRRNLRYDGVPFRPITVSKAEDKPRLLVLADVSLSVRATARFTLHLVHGLQDHFSQVRSFAFVAELAEITGLFARHQAEEALGLVFGGDVLDVDADSDYGSALGVFLEEFGSAVTRRSTVIVLGDGRGNGNDPNLPAFAEIARRARETIWLTPEPRYSWGLGPCDLPRYAEHCDRVRVVRDLSGLESAATELSAELTGR